MARLLDTHCFISHFSVVNQPFSISNTESTACFLSNGLASPPKLSGCQISNADIFGVGSDLYMISAMTRGPLDITVVASSLEIIT